MTKDWYEIYGKSIPTDKSTLLAKVKSKGLAYIVAERFKTIYIEITIK